MIALLLLLQDEIVTEERVRAVVEEMAPKIEKAMGLSYDAKPEFALSTAEAVQDLLVDEIIPQFRVQLAGASEAEIREGARGMAHSYALMVLGKFATKDRKIHVIAPNFKTQAEVMKNPRIHSVDFLRVVVLHELVHALDEQKYRASSRIEELKTLTELEIWNALLEGHAQYVTHTVLRSSQEGGLFGEFEKVMLSPPPGADESMKWLLAQSTQFMRFAYFDGKTFFDGLARSGRESFVEDVFKNPPKSKAVILKPETYYAPGKLETFDLKPLWEEIKKDRTEGWTSVEQELDASLIRTALSAFAKPEDLKEVLEKFRGGGMLVQQTAGGEKWVMIAVYDMGGPESAARMYDVMLATAKVRDEKMKEGTIRITKADYAELKVSGPRRHFTATKTMQVAGQEATLRSACFEVAAFVAVLVWSNEPVEDEAMAAMIEKVCRKLVKK